MFGITSALFFLFLSSGLSEMEESNMVYVRPPVEVTQSERRLEPDQITALEPTDQVRQIASQFENAVIASEEVTYDEAFGYIYRYDVKGLAKDDRGVEDIYNAKLVITASRTGELALFYGSLFEFPSPP